MKNHNVYPHFTRYFSLDAYIGNDGKFIQIPSSYKGSDEAKTNDILKRIHSEQGSLAFLRNRIRERAAILLTLLKGNDFAHIFPSQIVNDVLYGIDAIGEKDGAYYALDFTQNPEEVRKKLLKTPTGYKQLKTPSGNISQLPFRVVYISRTRVEGLLSRVETFLSHFAETDHIFPQEPEFMSAMQILVPTLSEGDIQIYENPPPSR